MALVILLYALYASVFTAAKIGVSQSEPFFLLATRMLIAATIILGFIYLFKKEIKIAETFKKSWRDILLLSLFNIYLTNGFEFWGLQYLSSSKTSFFYSLAPFIAALIGFLVYKERLSKTKWMGLALGILGYYPILWQELAQEEQVFSIGFVSLPEISIIAATASTIIGWVFMQKLIQNKIPFLLANGLSMLIGGIFALIHSLLVENWNPTPLFGNAQLFLESTLWMVVVSSLTCYNLNAYLLKRYSVTFMSFAAYITPFITAFYGYFLLGETVHLGFFLSAIIVFISLLIFNSAEIKKARNH